MRSVTNRPARRPARDATPEPEERGRTAARRVSGGHNILRAAAADDPADIRPGARHAQLGPPLAASERHLGGGAGRERDLRTGGAA